MVVRERFRSHDGRLFRQFGFDSTTGEHRCAGNWIGTNQLEERELSRLQSLGAMLQSLPGWPLADGLDQSKFIPDPHQLIVADTLATDWLGYTGIRPITRTRALIADEGGTGKTLSVAVAIRWIVNQPGARGPVIVLVPPLLKEHWAKHLRAVFNDDPDRIRVLRSARFYNEFRHQDDIIVVSKFSWIHHWDEVERRISAPRHPLGVVIDEAHQGRTGILEEMEEDLGEDEQGQGILLEEDEGPVTPTRHARVMRRTCAGAEYAIGVTATPININPIEIEYILRMLGAEQFEERGLEIEDDIPLDWQEAIAEMAAWAREADDGPEVHCPDEIMQGIIDLLDPDQPPTHWEGMNYDEIERLVEWLGQKQENDDLSARNALRLAHDLHPYGRHLCMTLRVDLDPRTARDYRIRTERAIRVDPGDGLQHYLEHVRRDGEQIGMLEQLRISTRLVSSHRWNPKSTDLHGNPRYGGIWDIWDGTDWNNIRTIVDPRIAHIEDLIREDLDVEEEQRTQRGCVIFTEFKGTIDSLGKEISERCGIIEGVSIAVRGLSSDGDLDSARKTLDECERMSMRANRYPILICTPAGEVGLDMAWATTLVHWDLNPNPQRMEQRTWRLDRRINDPAIRLQYRVVHILLEGVPHMERIEERINRRYNQAADSLGIERRIYIPPDGEDRPVVPGGSNHPCAIIDDEISRFEQFLHGGGLEHDAWPGPRLRQAERLRTGTLLYLTGQEHEPAQILANGRTTEIEPWDDLIEMGTQRIGITRDLENISPSFSGSLSPTLPRLTEPHHLYCSWEGDEGAHFPSALSALNRLFGPITSNWNNGIASPIIQADVEGVPERMIIAINMDIASHLDGRKQGFHDMGLRIISEERDFELGPADEEGWNLIQLCAQALLNGDVIGEGAAWEDAAVMDHSGQQLAEERIDILERRNQECNDMIQAYRNQIDEHGEDDDGHDRRARAIEGIEMTIEHRNEDINQLEDMQHLLTPVAILEVT